MPIHPDEVEAFFAAYGRRSNDALRQPPVADMDGLVAAFGPFFVAASPRGIAGTANDDSLRSTIAANFERYRTVGGTSMDLMNVEVVPIDDLNVMAKVGWRLSYDRSKDRKRGLIDFTSFYFLNRADGPLRIFPAVTPDEEATLRQEGLVA